MIRNLFRVRRKVLVHIAIIVIFYILIIFAMSVRRKRVQDDTNRFYEKIKTFHARSVSLRKIQGKFRGSVEQDIVEEVTTSVYDHGNLNKTKNTADITKRDVVKAMMLHAWQNYKQYAWGYNEVSPVRRRPHKRGVFGTYKTGATIIDSLDTLYLMDLHEEYEEARDWVERNFTMEDVNTPVSVFEVTIRFLGGFLSMYALTGDPLFKDKAKYVADKLLPAFETNTGIPYSLINPLTGYSDNYGWASGGMSILSEIGTLHLEFSYLSDITNNSTYREKVEKIRTALKQAKQNEQFYYNFIDPITGYWGKKEVSLGALGDSFYEYLLKSWIKSNKTDEEAITMFHESVEPIIATMMQTSQGGLTYFSNMYNLKLNHKMEHLACFSGGLFALAASVVDNDSKQLYMSIGENITKTCRESYVKAKTHLGPEAFRFDKNHEAETTFNSEQQYFLRPEVVESYFVLWRLTHDQKYRDWGWDTVEALNKYCKVPGGFSGLQNVYNENSDRDDVQQSFFLAETLKYLYLLFSDDSLIPFDKWVFNTEAHPIPIQHENLYSHKEVMV